MSYAQLDHNDYFYNNSTSEEVSQDIHTATEVFLVPLYQNKDQFARLSNFNFSAVRYARRGYDWRVRDYFLDNIKLSDNITSSTDFSLWSMLRRAGSSEIEYSGLSGFDQGVGVEGGVVGFSSNIYDNETATRVNLYMLNRKARGGGYLSSVGSLSPKWRYAVSAWGRWGRDPNIKGVFSDEISFSVNLNRRLGENHSLNLLVLGASQENGLRSYVTQEAIDLTGDKYYNPSWGYCGDKERNSKSTKRFQPLSLLKLESKLSNNTTLVATVAYRFGDSKYSALSWYKAETPYPDYYRNMPSYAENPLAEELIREKWRQGKSIRQIDWGEMFDANRNRQDGLAYLLEDRVERVSDFQLAVSGVTKVGEGVNVSYGVRGRFEGTALFKQVKDMLGGKPFEDIDQFLNTYPFDEVKQNNMQNPERLVAHGERFGYNYKMNGREYLAFGAIEYTQSKYKLSAAFELGQTTFQRNGHYEKELFPGAMSYGKSANQKFNTYIVKGGADYFFSPRYYLAVRALLSKKAPLVGEVFISPNDSNSTISNPKEIDTNAFEAELGTTFNGGSLKLVGFLTNTKNNSSLYRYYDDIASKYSDMIVQGIDKRFYGVELSFEYELSSRWSATAIAAWGRYQYVSDQNVDILEDASQNPYVIGAKAYMDGYKLGGTPQTVTSVEVKYNSFGWQASLTYSFMGDRYMTPNPLWRMERAYNLATSEEGYDAFVAQEKLKNANIVNLFLLKSFNIKKQWLTVMLSVNNLLGNKNVVYNGYEQMRVMRRGVGANRQFTPFDRKYLYGYGRTYYLSLTYKF